MTALPAVAPNSFRERIDEQSNALIHNATLFLTVHALWTKVYKQDFDYASYTQMFQEATYRVTRLSVVPDQTQALADQLKNVFFERVAGLDAASITALETQPSTTLRKVHILARKCFHLMRIYTARALYWLSTKYLLLNLVKQTVLTHVALFRNYKERMSPHDFRALKQDLLTYVERTLLTLNNAYTSPEGVTAYLQSAAANQGSNAEELYEKFVETLITTIYGNHLKGTAINIVQQSFSSGALVKWLVEMSMETIKAYPACFHTWNTLILQLLEQIEDQLTQMEQNLGAAANTPTPLPEDRRAQLLRMVTQLFELIDTVDWESSMNVTSVMNSLVGKPLLNRLIPLLSHLVDTFITEEQIDRLTLLALQSANAAFLPKAPTPQEELTRVDNAIKTRIVTLCDRGMQMGLDRTLVSTEPSFGAYYLPRLAFFTNMTLAVTSTVVNSSPVRACVSAFATGKVLSGINLTRDTNVHLCALHQILMIPHINAMRQNVNAPVSPGGETPALREPTPVLAPSRH